MATREHLKEEKTSIRDLKTLTPNRFFSIFQLLFHLPLFFLQHTQTRHTTDIPSAQADPMHCYDEVHCSAALLIDATYAYKMSRVSGYYEVAWFNAPSGARRGSYPPAVLHADKKQGRRDGAEASEKKEGRTALNESNYETSFNCAVGGQCVILHCSPLSFPFK